ncbi:hypothetical protein ABNX41_21585, partial [Rhodobacteraceae bacterium PA1-206B]
SRTIDRARELGIVMDRELIEKAQELDRRWQELNTTIGTWFKSFAVGAADAVQVLTGMRTELDSLLGDEGRARVIFGDEAYEKLKANQQAVNENADSIRDLDAAYGDLAENARAMAMQLLAAADQANLLGKDELWAVLAQAGNDMHELVNQFHANEIGAQDFAMRLGEIQTGARGAFDELDRTDQVSFTAAISQIDALGGKIGEVVGLAKSLFQWISAAAGMEVSAGQNTGTPLSSSDGGLLPPDPNTFVATSPRPRPAPAMTHELVDPGGRSSGRGGGRTRDEYAAMIEATQRQIALLEAEAAALLVAAEAGGEHAGMMDYARKRAELLMAAQRQGLVITPELTAEIEAQARAYATAGLEAEAAADRIRQIEEASERGRDALTDMFGSILDGSKSAKQAVADLLMEIAKAQMSKGLSSLLGLGGGGGFTGFVGGLLSFDGGGYTGSAPRTGGLDGKGGFLAIMHPRESVIDHTRGQTVGGGGAMAITVNVEGASGDQHIIGLVQQGVSAGLQSFDRALPDRLGQINRNPRYR